MKKEHAGGSPGDHRRRPLARLTNEEALEKASRLFRAIGDVPRLRLLALLAQGEACVSDLADAQKEGISTISQRLRILRSESLVVRRRQGKRINYGLADRHIVDLIVNALEHASELPHPRSRKGTKS